MDGMMFTLFNVQQPLANLWDQRGGVLVVVFLSLLQWQLCDHGLVLAVGTVVVVVVFLSLLQWRLMPLLSTAFGTVLRMNSSSDEAAAPGHQHGIGLIGVLCDFRRE